MQKFSDMSRIGKKPIIITEGVKVVVTDGKILVEGPKGKLERSLHPFIVVEVKEGNILVSPRRNEKKAGALWGLTRTLIANMIEGVAKGYEKKLELEGVGYRANLEGDTLNLQVGFSHPVKIVSPEGIKFSVEKNVITVSGIDKELVGRVAANLRKVRPPEPYKGKGIRYQGEVVKIKAGKKAVAGG